MNKSDIMKAAELSYEERVEAAAIAIANAAGSIITEFKGQSADFTELRRKQAKAALKAAGIDQLLKAAELLKQVEWQPIESAPFGETGKPETYFLGARQDMCGRINTATCYRNKYGAYEWWGGGLSPTHWMPIQPLPQPPVIIDKEGV